MIVKAANKSAQDLGNLRDILLADQEPDFLGSVLRQRLACSLKGCVAESQYGEGFGGGCEIAHLGMEAFNSISKTAKLTVVKVFLDVEQTFASIIASLCIPLSGRDDLVRTILVDNGFTDLEIDGIVEDGLAQVEWHFESHERASCGQARVAVVSSRQ